MAFGSPARDVEAERGWERGVRGEGKEGKRMKRGRIAAREGKGVIARGFRELGKG